MSGKGPRIPGVNLKNFYTNFPSLSGEYVTHADEIKKGKHGKTTYVYKKK